MYNLAYRENIYDAQPHNRGVLRINDFYYPKSLKELLNKHTPQELYFEGNISLLEKSGIGFCGSRSATEKGISTVRDCAEQVVEAGLVVISGNAAGIDTAAHFTALNSGGETILVLAEGINHFRIKRELRNVWDWSRVLVISQFKPEYRWQSFRAMSRNQIIIALSKVMIVIEASEKGGTIEAGKSTIRMNMPLFVAEYGDMSSTQGNSVLLSMGAQKLKKSATTEKAQLSRLLAAANQAQSSLQPSLF